MQDDVEKPDGDIPDDLEQFETRRFMQRFVKVEISNFTSGKKITIKNPIRIDFEFFKSIDEVKEASTGVVKIYNLTPETRRLISEVGSEVRLYTGHI